MPQPRSPAVDYAVPTQSRVSDDSALESMFSDAGVDMGQVRTQVNAEQAKARQERFNQLHQELDKIDTQRTIGKVQEGAAEVALGVGLGFRDIAKNTWNGLVTLADSAENYAASKGIGTGDLISEANKWEDSYGKSVGDNLGTTGNISRAVTNFAAPFLGTMAAGGGPMLGAGINAAYNFLAVDPKAARLSDHLKGTRVAEVPVAASVIDYLQHKPDDSELTSRFKNLAEGAGLDAALGGILWGASRAYSGVERLRAPRMAEAAEREFKSATTVAVNPKPVTTAEQAALDASDAKISSAPAPETPAAKTPPSAPEPVIGSTGAAPSPIVEKAPAVRTDHVPDTPDQLDLFERQWANLDQESPPVKFNAETGEVRMRLEDDQILEHFYNVAQASDKQVLHTPITDGELRKAADLMKNDSSVVERLASWDPSKGTPTPEETLVLKYIMSQGENSLMDGIDRVMANLNDESSLIKFSRELENYQRLAEIRQGTASAKGVTFRAERLVGALAKTGDKEAMRLIGAQGRAQLAQGLIEQYGGKANIQQMARNLDFVKDLSKVAERPDADFAMRMGDVVQKTAFSRVEDAITKVALNGMLSSPGTSLKAMVTNATTTAKTVADNYLSVAIGGALRSESGRTLAEANAHFNGVMAGFLEGVRPAWQVFRKGEAGKMTRMDLIDGAQKVLTNDEAMVEAGGAWAARIGFAADKTADVLTAKGMPVRVLMGVDTYWQTVNYRGVINSEATRLGMQRGFKGEELTKFIEEFSANPPAYVDQMATEIAQTNTMAKSLNAVVEPLDQAIENAGQVVPFMRVILPFFKTNANLVEYTVKNSALAFVASPATRQALAQGGRVRDEAIAKVLSGTTALAGLTWLAQNGLLNGRNTDNPEIERALKDNKTVAPETSVKMGDTWVSLKGLEPLSTLVDMAHMISKASGHLAEDDYQQAATGLAIMAAEVMTPEQLTDSLSGLLNVVAGKREGVDYLQTIPQRFVPFGGAVTDARQTIDPTMRVTKDPQSVYQTMKNRFANMVPYFSKDLPAQRNIWGEKLVLPDGIGPDAFSPMATTGDEGMKLKRAFENFDDYYETHKDVAMGLYKFDISMPPKQIQNPMGGGAYQFTAQEYSAYTVLAAGINPANGKPVLGNGKTLKDAVTDVMKRYDALDKKPTDYDPATYAAMVGELSKTFQMYRSAADKLILQFGDVQTKMREQAIKYRTFEEMTNVHQ